MSDLKAKSLTDTAANSADAAKENLERSPDMQSNTTGLRGALARTADVFGKAFGALGTAVGATIGGLPGAEAANELYNKSALDAGFDSGVNYVFDTIEDWQHRK